LDIHPGIILQKQFHSFHVAPSAGEMKDSIAAGVCIHLSALIEKHSDNSNVPVDDSIRLALCGMKSPLTPWLALAQAMENADWEKAGRIAKSAGLSLVDLSRCHLESLAEADTLFRLLPAPVTTPSANVRS